MITKYFSAKSPADKQVDPPSEADRLDSVETMAPRSKLADLLDKEESQIGTAAENSEGNVSNAEIAGLISRLGRDDLARGKLEISYINHLQSLRL